MDVIKGNADNKKTALGRLFTRKFYRNKKYVIDCVRGKFEGIKPLMIVLCEVFGYDESLSHSPVQLPDKRYDVRSL